MLGITSSSNAGHYNINGDDAWVFFLSLKIRNFLTQKFLAIGIQLEKYW
jgi:hypothetical protein